MKWKAGRSAGDNAAAALPKLVEPFFEGGRKASAAANQEALHRFRIRVKRFRYTLELFRPCYGPALDRRLETLRRLQSCLGQMGDLNVVVRLAGRSPVAGRARRELRAKVGEFQRMWGAFDREGAAGRWRAYLKRVRR